jgi:hypothetical protein
MILEVSMATKPLVLLPDEAKGEIEWTADEAKLLWSKALDWWNNDKALLNEDRGVDLFGGMGKDSILATLECFDLFLARAVFPYMKGWPDAEWTELLDFVYEANDKGACLARCRPYILVHRPERKAEVEHMIKSGLAEGAEITVDACSLAIRHWIHLAGVGIIEEPSYNLLGELINRVLFRRPEGIHSCIRQVSLLLIEKPNVFTWEIVQMLIASLVPWHVAIKLPADNGIGGDFPTEERPDMRALVGMLAAALSKWLSKMKPEIDEPTEISLWRETCDQDPLPEVNRAFRTWADFQIASED